MAEITASNSKNKKGIFSTSHNRRSTRVDLTPMVDLGFLLITFFVFTTSMTEPKAMELMEAHDGPPGKVKESFAMTIILGKKHQVYYYRGSLDQKNAINQIMKTDLSNIRPVIVNMKNNSDPGFLMYIIKADDESTFADNINLLDEMAICNIQAGHYAELEINEDELEVIKKKGD